MQTLVVVKQGQGAPCWTLLHWQDAPNLVIRSTEHCLISLV